MPLPLKMSNRSFVSLVIVAFFSTLQRSVGEQEREEGDMAVLDSICKLLKLAFTAHKLSPSQPDTL